MINESEIVARVTNGVERKRRSREVRIDLGGVLEGEYAMLDPRKITRGLIDDFTASVNSNATGSEQTRIQLATNDGVLAAVISSISMEDLPIAKDTDKPFRDWPMEEFRELNNAVWERINEYIGGPKKQTSTDLSTTSSPTDSTVS